MCPVLHVFGVIPGHTAILLHFLIVSLSFQTPGACSSAESTAGGMDWMSFRLMDSRREQSIFYNGCIQWPFFFAKTHFEYLWICCILYTGMFFQVLEESESNWQLDVVCIFLKCKRIQGDESLLRCLCFCQDLLKKKRLQEMNDMASTMPKLMVFFHRDWGQLDLEVPTASKVFISTSTTYLCERRQTNCVWDSHRKFQEQ